MARPKKIPGAQSLTIKQENFCQAYVRLGDKTAAYREAYNASNMKPETVNNNAYKLILRNDIGTRIKQLEAELKERHKVTLDEVLGTLASMLRFDVSTLYNEDGSLKNIHDMPKESRLMIHEVSSDELFLGKEKIGQTKRVKTYSKTDAIEKLMKHLGGYERDNAQKTPPVTSVKVEIIAPEDTD